MDQTDDKRNSAKLLSIVIAVVAAIGWYLYFDQRQQQRVVSEDLNATRAKFEIEVQSLSQNLSDSKARNLELSELNESLQADVAVSLAEKSALRQKMQQELESVLGENRELQRELESTAAARQELQRELESTTAAQQELQRELESTASARQELQAELDSRLAEQEMLNQQIVLAMGASGELEKQLQQEEERRRQLQQRIDTVSGDIQLKEQALSDADKRFAELQQQLEQTHQVQAKLEQQLEQTHQAQAKLEQTVEELSRQRAEEAAHFARLQDALKRELNESRVEISQLKNRMTVIKLTSEVLFNSGSAEIRPEGKRVLSLIAESLNAYPDRAISIEGHTDNVPIGNNSHYASNWELSAARAHAAVDYFEQKSQVEPGRLQLVGLGEFHPVASNESAEGRAQNRRIEIRLLPGN